jgi:hypothetical protein
MKAIIISTLAGILFALPTFAETVTSKEVQIGINSVYVPGGFDSHSDVFVVVNGIFPNGCYQWGRADVKNKDTFTHEISSIANVSQGMCIMVLIPFQKEVRLGKFATGQHNLRFLNGDGTYIEKSMIVE